jgi:tetratricopeptide (TPR) repeat protein
MEIISKKFQVLFLLFLISSSVNAQTVEEAQVKKVYGQLIQAIGDNNKLPPKLIFTNKKENVAAYYPGDKNCIEFEYDAYLICRSMGKDSLNAIAFLLGHELGHFYRNHGFLKSAASAYANTSMGEKLASEKIAADTTIKCETEADEFACFYTKMAGFSISNAGSFIKQIYKGYELPEDIKKYPSLKDRCLIADNAQAKMSELNSIFQMANVLSMQNEFANAAILYRYILSKNFGSREIKNNLGICYAMQGVRLMNPDWQNLIFPFSLDPLSRAGESYRDLSVTDSLEAVKLLQYALQLFEEASNLDKVYLSSRINTAMALCLLNKNKKALNRLEELEDDFKENAQALMQIEYTRALMEYITKKDKASLVEIANKGNKIAKRCLDNLNNKTALVKREDVSSLVSLRALISKNNFSEPKISFRSGDDKAKIYQRDSIGVQLISLEIGTTSKKFFQIICSFSDNFFNIKTDLPKSPDIILEQNNSTIEKWNFSSYNYYRFKRGDELLVAYVIFN